jgi:hypothetical protein
VLKKLQLRVPGPLTVGFHDSAQVGRLVGHVLQVGLEELRQHGERSLHVELLQRVQSSVVQVRMTELACRRTNASAFIPSKNSTPVPR